MKKRSTANYKLPKGKILGYRTANAAGQAHGGFQWIDFDSHQSALEFLLQIRPESVVHGISHHAGYESTHTAGYRSTQTAGDYSTQTAGNDSTQTAGYRSTQTAGNESTQTAGYRSTQTAGDYSTQTAGDYSTFTGGIGTVQICRYYNNDWKASVQIVGENGVEPNVSYVCRQGVWTRKDGER